MSLINFVPFALDDFDSFKALKSLSREGSLYPSLSSGYEEDEKEIRYSIDVPGVKAADLEVTVQNSQLNVSGSRRTKSSDGKTTKRARFARTFSLEEDTVDISKMKANLADGVLVVTVPKKPHPEPVKITITTNNPEEEIRVEQKKTQSIEASKENENKDSEK